jgi:hypothetical protein
VTGVGQEVANLSVISPSQRRRLLAGSIVLLAVALLGLAAKAKTSHYSVGPQNSTHFSASVKIAENAHPLRILISHPLMPTTGLPPVVCAVSLRSSVRQVVKVVSEPLAGLRPLRAPPAFFS